MVDIRGGPLKAALDWCERGYLPVPIPHRSKKPVLLEWQNLRIDSSTAQQYFNEPIQNIGVLLGDQYGSADADCDCPEAVSAASRLLPPTGMIFGRASKPSSHFFYRCDPSVRSKKYIDPADTRTLCELRCQKIDGTVGLQTVVPPSTHKDTGEAIRFEEGFDRQPSNVEAVDLQRAVAKVASAALLAKHWPSPGHGRHACELALAGVLASGGWSCEDATEFLLATYTAVPTHDRSKLSRVVASVRDTFSKRAPAVELTGWPTLAQYVSRPITQKCASWLDLSYRSGNARAKERSVGPTARLTSERGEVPDLLLADSDVPPYTDQANALRIERYCGRDMRFNHIMKRWFLYDGRRWQADFTDQALVRATDALLEYLRQTLKSGNDDARKHAKTSLDERKLRTALMSAERRLVVQVDHLDQHPFLLNCQNGTLDLVIGQLHEHRREDFITKLVQFNYAPKARCPRFLAFLDRIMGGGPGVSEAELDRAARLISFLQKAFGLALTGDVSDGVVICLFGVGRNGKTTLLQAIRHVVQEYSTQILVESLMAHQQRDNNSAADLADLRGARFVTTSEAEEGQRLAVGKLKYLTSRMGKLKAVRKYENPIEFEATHKLFLDANHKPVVRGNEQAIWDRLKPIPCTVRIPDDEVNPDLLDRLKEEGPGILAWMVEGCRRWKTEGLGNPPEISAATDDWQAESDPTSEFVDECCVVRAAGNDTISYRKWPFVKKTDLWRRYCKWAEDSGERHPLPKSKFQERIKSVGCIEETRLIEGTSQRVWFGIRLRNGGDPP